MVPEHLGCRVGPDVMRQTVPYIYFRSRHSRESGNPVQKLTGFRVKPGMTNEVKGFLVHCTNIVQAWG